VFAAWATGGFFVLGISAYHLMKKNESEWVKSSLKIGIIFSLVSTILVVGMGDAQGKYLVKHLPMKMAAAEALWNSEDPASLGVVAIIDEGQRKNTFEISIPKLLSFMSYSKFEGKVEGLNQLQAQYEAKYGPGNYIPPVTISFYAFRLMVGAGSLMLILSIVALYFLKKKNIDKKPLLLKLLVFSIALPYIANSTGWILTEVSRSPWIVFGLLKISNAVSPNVSAGYILTSLIALGVVYTALIIVDVSLMVKSVKKPLLENKNKKFGLKGDKGESLWI
jgi:cytochrome d ubiquinol oxidase subunit I